jgi:ADP-ribosyl-[dinitrogen reductase] hydrolase
MSNSRLIKDRCLGALVGLAVGDAIGTTLEFKPFGRYGQREMEGGGPFNLRPGEWTDDTSMALCLAESLIKFPALNTGDLLSRFYLWREKGRLSVTGKCFDIGTQTSQAIDDWLLRRRIVAANTETKDNVAAKTEAKGNGCIMRLAPVAIRWHHRNEMATAVAEAQTVTTHNNPSCIIASRLLVNDLVSAINGHSIIQKRTPKVYSSGEVGDTYAAAHWALSFDDGFESVVLRAANMGGDADTVAAVAGQMAGAVYGLRAIPSRWRARLAWYDTIHRMAEQLYEGSLT